MRKLLVTGFEPFGGSTVNPSEKVIRALDSDLSEKYKVYTCLLPVDRERGPKILLASVDSLRPDAVLCFGEAAGRSVISIERVAINLLDYRIPDNAGVQVVDEPVVPGGPAAYFASIPVREILTSLREAGIPSELSLSAGAFLCNQVFYRLLHHLSINSLRIPAGFIHLPALPEQAAAKGLSTPSMSLETLLSAVKITADKVYETSL